MQSTHIMEYYLFIKRNEGLMLACSICQPQKHHVGARSRTHKRMAQPHLCLVSRTGKSMERKWIGGFQEPGSRGLGVAAKGTELLCKLLEMLMVVGLSEFQM